MTIKQCAAFLAAACLFGSSQSEARHLAERRADEARAVRQLAEAKNNRPAPPLETNVPPQKKSDAVPSSDAPGVRHEGEAEGESRPAERSAERTEAIREDAHAPSPSPESGGSVPAEAAPAAERTPKPAPKSDDEISLRRYLDRLRGKAEPPPAEVKPAPQSRTAIPMKAWAADVTDDGGTLLFSDSPEYVDRPGILYTDEVSGAARILFYHLNQTKQPVKVLLLVENTSGRPSTVEITRRGLSQPSEDYLAVGKATQAAYFSLEQKSESFTLKPRERRLLMAELNKITLAPESLIYGVADFSSTASIRLWVLMAPAKADPFLYLKSAPLLPKDEHRLRGTFAGMNRTIRARAPYDPARDGAVYLTIGDNDTDRFCTGIDATDGSLVTNFGNYGILYRVEVPIQGKKPVRALLNPIGGVYAGVMRVTSAEEPAWRVVPTPLSLPFFGHDVADTVPMRGDVPLLDAAAAITELGAYRKTAGITFELSPPGASNLPARLILLPADAK
ncbi:MAG: copper amine oxidase [Schwartzia sp. (in: firmicutes)]